MTKRMLIDATHAEETRVVVLDGNRLEDFDVETSTKKQLKGNIYLAKVVRVEPSLQAAFVEYGGGRHGFLAFGEIHPDYYQIPVADRERLLRLQVEEARAEEAAEEAAEAAAESGHSVAAVPVAASEPGEELTAAEIGGEAPAGDAAFASSGLPEGEDGGSHGVPVPQGAEDATVLDLPMVTEGGSEGGAEPRMPDLPPEEGPPEQGGMIDASLSDAPDGLTDAAAEAQSGPLPSEPPVVAIAVESAEPSFADTIPADAGFSTASFPEPDAAETRNGEAESGDREGEIESVAAEAPPPETVGGESEGGEERSERRVPSRYLRNYKIQEVIRRRQIMLVQVVKEERGTKGAALTTYISLAGRFSVLMPNSPRGGGISRKITSAADRRRLKEITTELAIPDGMGLIVRTAGANRPKPEIKRDCEYLLRLWDDIRETTMNSVAPALIHEEASLIKRAIRDVYSRDVDEVLVDGEEGWKAARDVMRMLMPAHARKVISWRDHPASQGQPLFASQQVEAQLDAMMSPNVQLRSGGYLVIDQTEALVAIDVNSGRSTRERGIEETALRTNLEAADEVARQLRLRDLAGLIVIDFIDMESKKHNAMVERRLKEALKVDRARIQVGQISHFGLMEMSRQRLRPSLAENSFVTCPHCGGAGHVRSTESSAIHVLRGIEEEGAKRRAAEILVHVSPGIAMYIFNHKRDRLADIERRYGMQVVFEGDAGLIAPAMRIDRVRAAVPVSAPETVLPAPVQAAPMPSPVQANDDEEPDLTSPDLMNEDEAGESDAAPAAPGSEEEARRRRRRRRRRGRRDDGMAAEPLPGVAELGAEQPELPGDTLHGGMPAGSDAVPEATGPEAVVAGAASPAVPGAGDVPTEALPGEVTPGEAVGSDEEGGDRPRRRGRRGGRRRRRDETGAFEAEPELPVEPAYTGPTPANPFGGIPFDIYDVMEQAEQTSLAPAAAAPVAVPAEPAPEAPVSVETSPIETATAEVAAAAPPEPAPRGLHLVQPVEPPPEPLIKPVVIDGAAPAPERKRGWWRR